MNNNTYFIIENNQELFTSIFDYIVENSIDTTRKSVDGTKIVVKLPVGDSTPAVMSEHTPYTHSEILAVLSTPEWTTDII